MESRCASDAEVKNTVGGEKTEMDSANGVGSGERGNVTNGRNGAMEEENGGSGRGDGFSAQKPVLKEPAESARSPTMPSPASNATLTPSTELTIFYGGKVNVFDGISLEKVHEILRIAAAAADSVEMKNMFNGNSAPSPCLTRSPSLQSSAATGSPGARGYPIRENSFCRLQNDLPIARRQSLQRFLEKRRDRLGSKNPYSTPDMKKIDEEAVSLGTKTPSDTKTLMNLEENKPKAVAHLA